MPAILTGSDTVITLRRLTIDEMDAAALVHRATFDAQLPWLAGLHTPDEDRCFFRERVFTSCCVWGAFHEDEGCGDADAGKRTREVLVGIVAFRSGWIEQLYVLPQMQGRGVGSRLLDVAKREVTRAVDGGGGASAGDSDCAQMPTATNSTLRLWTFQRNERARQFYEARAFAIVEETDGRGNEEREPDVLYLWNGQL